MAIIIYTYSNPYKINRETVLGFSEEIFSSFVFHRHL